MCPKYLLKKITAFTIMELSVSMAISAIVIMMSYTIYSIVGKGYIDFSAKNDELSSLLRADELIKKDFSSAKLILLTEKGILIQDDKKLIDYTFDRDKIIRQTNSTDTFKLEIKQRQFLFENRPVNETYSIYDFQNAIYDTLKVENSRIDELYLTILFRNEKIPLTYHKIYSATDLLDRK